MKSRVRMRHLNCFLEVARQKSITRAAEALHTVQPAISRSLTELEAEIGQKLFVRTNKGMMLTKAGETFYQHAQGGVLQILHGISAVQGQDGEDQITISSLPNVVRNLVPRAVSAFKDVHPETSVIVETRFYADALQRLRQGLVHFSIGRLLGPEHLSGLRFEYLYSEPIIFAACASHPLAGQKGLSLQDIREQQIVVPIEESILRIELDKYLHRNGVEMFENRVETLSYEFCRAYLKTNNVIGCMPAGVIRDELASGSFVQLDVPKEGLDSAVGMTFAADKALAPKAERLAEIFRKIARS